MARESAKSILERGWLIEKESIDPAKLVTKGWGESKPNDTEDGRQKNRRLEAVIEKASGP